MLVSLAPLPPGRGNRQEAALGNQGLARHPLLGLPSTRPRNSPTQLDHYSPYPFKQLDQLRGSSITHQAEDPRSSNPIAILHAPCNFKGK
jgi:hypothetical protein